MYLLEAKVESVEYKTRNVLIPQLLVSIRMKYEYAREQIRTVEDFIDKVASRSWVSGRDYIVRLPDGNEIKAKKWLSEQLAKLSESKVKNQ